ncbi:MAG: RNA polymerase sigma factor [Pseudomonadota bacterium]
MSDRKDGFQVQSDVRGPWRQYLDELEPIRPELYGYCLKLTRNAWDAEDLAQDALLRVFSSLGKIDADIENPKGYLMRTASNLWIDAIRKQSRHQGLLVEEDPATEDISERSAQSSEAARELLSRLHPQERAALVMKDVLDLSLAEIATVLNTSVGAIKSALHRARSRVDDEGMAPAGFVPDQQIVDQFMQALASTDLDTLRTICSTELHVELVGGAELHSFDKSSSFFEHAHFVMPEIGFGENPRWELAEYAGEPIVIGFRTLNGQEGLNEIHRLEVTSGTISRVRCYCFCPDTLKEVGQHLGLDALSRTYRSPG